MSDKEKNVTEKNYNAHKHQNAIRAARLHGSFLTGVWIQAINVNAENAFL